MAKKNIASQSNRILRNRTPERAESEQNANGRNADVVPESPTKSNNEKPISDTPENKKVSFFFPPWLFVTVY
jgi:hypothetical protein